VRPPCPGPRREHRHHHRRFGPLHGIHHALLGVVWMALLLGTAAGLLLHASWAASQLPWHGYVCATAALVPMAWLLAWMATARVMGPMRALARVASELQEGRLERRSALVSSTGEVGEVSEALRSVADRLARQLDDQRALMATVSHELRSPLARVQVLVDMVREGSAPATLPDELEREVQAMDQLVGDLLAAARIDFAAVRPRDLSLRDVLQRATELARVDVQLQCPDPGHVYADPTLLTRALCLLLDNARQHGGQNVSLEVVDREPFARILVRDDGPGFSVEEAERLFEPFWRGERSSGVGLGLSLVRRIARAHGGETGVEPGAGGRVWLEIPRRVTWEA
jgi:two-component system OmpR family sensor kinase